ncbi:MAG: hypothetical protein PGN15_11060 [Aeromicrobium erythreum]
MSTTPTRRRTRLMSLLGAGALAAATLAVVTPSAGAAPAASAASDTVSEATFTWGLSGYAQDGIFGAWTFKDPTGDARYLAGDVSTVPNTSPQQVYRVDPVPTTSFPTSKAGKAPNVVQFTGGDGTVDRSTGAAELSWSGSYTVNAYPAQYGAPDEIYADPQLDVEPDGSGTLTMRFTIGAGQSMTGEAFPAKDFGRLTIATFDAGSLSAQSSTGYRVTPDYQGVTWDAPSGATAQTRTCSAQDGATGWWGAWPTDFLDALATHEAGTSVLAHFYSTGCAGKQDNKPQLPFDVTFAQTPTVTVSDTEVTRGDTTSVTVEGRGFDPSLATGTRPPFAGQKSGVYVAFGRYADVWRPSQGAPSSARANADSGDASAPAVKWAVPRASFAASSPAQDPAAPNYTELRPDGSFTATIPVDEDWLKDRTGTYGIYTYAGGGATVAAYETATPLTFVDPAPEPLTPTLSRGSEVKPTRTTTGSTRVTVASPDDAVPTGTVHTTLVNGSTTLTGPKATLKDGKATVTVPRATRLGRWTSTVHYSGDTTHAAATGATTTIEVTRYAATVRRPSTTRPTKRKTGRATVVVTSGSPAQATGTVRAVLKKGRTVRYSRPVTLKNGRAVVGIPAAGSTGTWTYFIRYSGDANHPAKDGTRTALRITR